MSRLEKVCEYLHMPAQSGSDEVLKRMRRGYTAGYYREFVRYARELILTLPLPVILLWAFRVRRKKIFRKRYD